jgi:ribosomal peptide maturation radical SAM protein 1
MRNRRDTPRSVALVEMPFGPMMWPSIGTSLLKAQLTAAGYRSRVLYLNAWFLRYVGAHDRTSLETYHEISDAFGPHLGEWIFAPAAFPDSNITDFDDEYLDKLGQLGSVANLREPARRLRRAVRPFLTECLRGIDWHAFDVIGFANSYSQLNASIALARMIRNERGPVPMIVGGCGCSDAMGAAVLRVTPLFRAAAIGEADLIVSDLVEAVCDPSDDRLAEIPGIAYRRQDGDVVYSTPKQRVRDLNALPFPDYEDFYDFRPPELVDWLPFYIPVESSRGCWWGAKSHCTFCGLNPERMAFFQKEPARFLAEIGHLAARHHPRRFMCVDNIMPHRYHTEVVPHLADYSRGAEVFFEIKANLRREHVESFRRANIRQVQPGIESLSTPVLQMMGKGITAIANIHTLRLCQEFGLRAHWSILFGFAREQRDHYRMTAELIRRIRHLRPPLGLVQVEVERFAPMFRMPREHGLTNLRPSEWYRFCYPVEPGILQDLAYRFDTDYIDRPVRLSREIEAEIRPLVAEWQAGYDAGEFVLERRGAGDRTRIHRRLAGDVVDFELGHVASVLYEDLLAPHYVSSLVPELGSRNGREPMIDEAFMRRAIAATPASGSIVRIDARTRAEAYSALLLHGLIVEEGGQAVAVACDPAANTTTTAVRREVPEMAPPICS